MTEPSERDLEMAREFILAGHSPIYEDQIASLLAAARAEEACRIAKLSEELERWKSACRQNGICMSCAGGQSMQPCTDCLGTGWDGGAPLGYIESSQLHAARAEERERCAAIVDEQADHYIHINCRDGVDCAETIATRIRSGQ